MDHGYYGMYQIMKPLQEVRVDGIVILDHIPDVLGGHDADQACGLAYMKALRNRALAEETA